MYIRGGGVLVEFQGGIFVLMIFELFLFRQMIKLSIHTVTPRYNAVVGRHLLRPPYKRGALWDPVDLFDIIIPRQSKGQGHRPSSPKA